MVWMLSVHAVEKKKRKSVGEIYVVDSLGRNPWEF